MIVREVRGIPDAATLAEAAACIASGGTLIFPTETVYGIGCAPANDAAIAAVFAAKNRPLDKPLAIHIAHPQDAGDFASRLSAGARAIVEAFWPGPVTIVVERRIDRYASAARNGPTIGLRCPDHDVCRAILGATGPLAATSANVSGKSAFTGTSGDRSSLPDASMAIIAGSTSLRRESTVLDCSGDAIRILRAGAVDAAAIERALRGIAPLAR